MSAATPKFLPWGAATLVLGLSVAACDGSAPNPDLDPRLGRDCFEKHRAELSPGAQYEGFAVEGGIIRVKVMTDTGLGSVTCDAPASR